MVKQLLKFKAFLLLVVLCMATSAAQAYDHYLHFEYSFSVSTTPTGAGLVYAQTYQTQNLPSPEDFQPRDDQYVEEISETSFHSVGYNNGDPVPTECPAVLDLWAKANPGYKFDGWALADAPDVIVSTNPLYEIYPVLTSTDEANPHVFNYIAKFSVSHTHAWAEVWTQTETAHYHACTAENCDITDYSTAPAEAAYAEHEYGTDINETAYYTCSVCEYENDIRRQGYVDAIAAGAVVAKIEAIGTVEFTEECRILIDSARAAYEALTNDQKALITDEQLQVLIDAETTYNLMALAQPVIDLIDAIDTIDDLYLDAQSIAAARNAYDALIPEAQAYVTNYDALLEAEQKYSEMSDFYVYRNFRAIELGLIAQPGAILEVRKYAVEAEQLLQSLEYSDELTLDQNKANVDEIYTVYRNAIRELRKQVAKETIFDAAKTAGKANIRLFLGLSRSEGAAAAAEEGIAAIDALEYDNDADIIANIDDVNDIVIDTKVAIVKAWIADFNAIRSAISASLRQTSADKAAEVEALSYDRNQTYDENVAKLNAFAQNEVTAIEAIGTTAARHNGKYIENGKIVIVKDGKTYTAGGQVK